MRMNAQERRALRRSAHCGAATATTAPAIVEGLEARQHLAFSASINFQPASSAVPAGFSADTGSVYAARSNGLTYGWNASNTANTRDRNSATSPSEAHDTFAYSQRSGGTRWDLAVPTGVYSVRVVAGDSAAYEDLIYGYNVEGTVIASGTPTKTKLWMDGTGLVRVSDGKLTVNNASGTRDNRINFITVTEVVPEGLRAMAASNSKISLRWKDVMYGETGYRIERSTDGENFSSIGTVGANVTSYTDMGRSVGVNYTYRVKCLTAVGDSGPSETASAKIVTGGLQASFDSKGLSKVSYKGVTLFDITVNPSEGLKVMSYKLEKPDGTIEDRPGTPVSSSWNAATKEATLNFTWGKVFVQYIIEGDRLKILARVENTSADTTLKQMSLSPVTFRFPEMPENFKGWPALGYNTNGPTAMVANYESGQVVLANDDVMSPLTVGYMSCNTTATDNRYNVLISTASTSKPTFAREVGPQQGDDYSISLRFGFAGASSDALSSDVYTNYVTNHPTSIQWDDRRAIGMLFMQDNIAQGISATNPHGWWGDPTVDTKSSTGLAKFKTKFLAGADSTVAILKQMNAQGAIVWDLEGEQYKGGVYVGDPRVATTLLPEYDYNNLIDQYFKKFTDAGLKIGVTIRPSEFRITGTNTGGQFAVAEPSLLMIDKVRYARQRWGVKMFYVDSNDNMRPEDISALSIEFPDTLFIPEHEGAWNYAFSAPYGEVREGYVGTPALSRTLYPGSFSVIEAVNGPVSDYRPQLVESVRRGDILMFQAWFNSANNTLIKSIYDEAGVK